MYKIFDTYEEARTYNHNIAIQKGFGGQFDICQYWYNIVQTQDNKYAIDCEQGNIQSIIQKQITNQEI